MIIICCSLYNQHVANKESKGKRRAEWDGAAKPPTLRGRSIAVHFFSPLAHRPFLFPRLSPPIRLVLFRHVFCTIGSSHSDTVFASSEAGCPGSREFLTLPPFFCLPSCLSMLTTPRLARYLFRPGSSRPRARSLAPLSVLTWARPT
jgi:hypothetical protein